MAPPRHACSPCLICCSATASPNRWTSRSRAKRSNRTATRCAEFCFDGRRRSAALRRGPGGHTGLPRMEGRAVIDLPWVRADGDPPLGTGVCLSGGGIRAASLALSALQALQAERGLLFGRHATDHLAWCREVRTSVPRSCSTRQRSPPPRRSRIAPHSPRARRRPSMSWPNGRYLLRGGVARTAARLPCSLSRTSRPWRRCSPGRGRSSPTWRSPPRSSDRHGSSRRTARCAP